MLSYPITAVGEMRLEAVSVPFRRGEKTKFAVIVIVVY